MIDYDDVKPLFVVTYDYHNLETGQREIDRYECSGFETEKQAYELIDWLMSPKSDCDPDEVKAGYWKFEVEYLTGKEAAWERGLI